MLKKFFIPIVIFIVAIAFFTVMLSTREVADEIKFKEHVWRIEQTIVEKQRLSPSITLYGRIESHDLLNAAAPVSSQVEKVLIKEGQHIKKGQLMLVLEYQQMSR